MTPEQKNLLENWEKELTTNVKLLRQIITSGPILGNYILRLLEAARADQREKDAKIARIASAECKVKTIDYHSGWLFGSRYISEKILTQDSQ